MSKINVPNLHTGINMDKFVTDHKLPPSILDNIPQDEQRLVGMMAWMTQHLSSWSDQEKTNVALEVIEQCKYGCLVPRLKDPYQTWSKKDWADQIQLEKTYLDKLFDFFKDQHIPLSDQAYGSWCISSGVKTHLFDKLHKEGIVIKSKSELARKVWNNALYDNEHKTLDIIKWLVDHKVFPDFATMSYKNTSFPVFFDVKSAHTVEKLKLVPSEHLKPSLNLKDKNGRVAMHYAVATLIPSFVQLLVDLGADKNPIDNKGKYPLDMIKRTTTRVEHIGQIQEMLGAQTSKTPQQILEQAIKTLDLTLLNKALQNPTLQSQINTVAFNVLEQPILNTTPTTYKKMRKRKMELFSYLLNLNQFDFETKDDEGNTLLHVAVKMGLPKAVDELLSHSLDLAQQVNIFNKRADQMMVEEFDQLLEHNVNGNPWTPNWRHAQNEKKQIDTSKKILKMYAQHKVHLFDTSFPVLRKDPEATSILERARLKQSLATNNPSTKPRKM